MWQCLFNNYSPQQLQKTSPLIWIRKLTYPFQMSSSFKLLTCHTLDTVPYIVVRQKVKYWCNFHTNK
jgi:hypothetical protein